MSSASFIRRTVDMSELCGTSFRRVASFLRDETLHLDRDDTLADELRGLSGRERVELQEVTMVPRGLFPQFLDPYGDGSRVAAPEHSAGQGRILRRMLVGSVARCLVSLLRLLLGFDQSRIYVCLALGDHLCPKGHAGLAVRYVTPPIP
jgi:hypothetical protein